MELNISKKAEMKFRFENTKHKMGVRIWGDRESFHELHELLTECWNCEDEEMSRAEECSYIGIISYFSYEVRHAFMGSRLVLLDGNPMPEWDDEFFQIFEKGVERIEVGMEMPWSHMLFIMASWWECLRHKDCPARVIGIMREFMENIEQLLQQRSKVQYPKIEPYLHGAIYAANPYLMHFMEKVYYEYVRQSRYGRPSLSALADEMRCTVFDTYQYNDYMTHLKKHAKRLDCAIEELRVNVDDSIYDIEL